MLYFFHIVFLFKIQPSIPPFLVYGRYPHLPIEFNMRPNSYPEYYDMDSNLERNVEGFFKFPLMILLVHINMQAMIQCATKSSTKYSESSVQAEGML